MRNGGGQGTKLAVRQPHALVRHHERRRVSARGQQGEDALRADGGGHVVRVELHAQVLASPRPAQREREPPGLYNSRGRVDAGRQVGATNVEVRVVHEDAVRHVVQILKKKQEPSQQVP